MNRRKDGSEYHEEQTIAPVLDENGAITHFIAIKQDVTERRRIQDELARADKALYAAKGAGRDRVASAEGDLPRPEAHLHGG